MSKDGLVEKLLCPVDQSFLFSNQDLEDNIYLYCLDCNYKSYIGINTYQNIVKEVESNGKNNKM
jgi:hypothetical protein